MKTSWPLQRADSVLSCRRNQVTADELNGRSVFHYSIPVVLETGNGQIEDGGSIDSSKFRLAGHELLVSKLNPRKGCLIIAEPKEEWIVCSTEFVVLRPSPQINARFAFFVYSSEPARQFFDSMTESATLSHKRVNPSVVSKLWLPFPPPHIQRAIVNFLERKTGAIDALIAKKRRQVELLAEKRAALINQAVTKGLDPTVPMKDSGIPWIGEIPAHWEVTKLKYCASMIGGFAFSSVDFGRTGVQLLKIANLYQNRLSLERQPSFVDTSFLLTHKSFVINTGDLLMSLTGTLGKRDYGYVIEVDADGPFLLNQRVGKICIFRSKLTTPFAKLMLWSRAYLEQIYTLPFGTKQANLSNDDVLNPTIACPPLEEQAKIALVVSRLLERQDDVIDKQFRSIEQLQEYRQALITAAVTGQLEIPVSEPEEAMV